MKSLSRRNFLKTAGAVSAAVISGFEASAQNIPNRKKPNILLLMTDQHRADCLGCAGNKVVKTPNLDRLAQEGFYFPNAYSSTPTCTPARSALLTGLSPWHHGMLGYGRVADRYPVEMPRAIREAGYYTIGIGKMHWSPQRNSHGFHQMLLDESSRVEDEGFESDYRKWFREHAPAGITYDCTGIGWNDYRSRVYVPPEGLHPTVWTAQTAIDFIEKYNDPSPFFMKVSFARPHSPYDPPQRFWDAFQDDAMPPPSIGKWAAKFAPAKPDDFSLWHGDLGFEQARKSRRGYYGSVLFIDEQIGGILSSLERRGFLDNTLILFSADHGDMLGDHNLWRKSYAYESSARIPFIVRPPKGMFTKQNQKCEQVVELRDVLPTLLDAAGQRLPAHLDGRSVLEIFRGKTDTWRQFIDMEHDICYDASNHWNALTDGNHKYIYHAQKGEEQLFDLKNDPGELRDLAQEPENRNKVREWRERLISHFSERGEPFIVDGDLKPRPNSTLYSPNYPK